MYLFKIKIKVYFIIILKFVILFILYLNGFFLFTKKFE